jgi:hypothetical protein
MEDRIQDLADPGVADLEQAVADHPGEAMPLVRLANSYWLEGRGSDVVGEIAERARKLDPNNRGAWHLWALSEMNPRARTDRWRQVTVQFPDDDVALASLGDNAASLAGAEHDYVALDMAIDTYMTLLARTTDAEPREAIEKSLVALRKWRF